MGHVVFLLLVVANFLLYCAREGEQRGLFRGIHVLHESVVLTNKHISRILLGTVELLMLALGGLEVVSLVAGSLRVTIVV